MFHNRLPFLEMISYEADFPITTKLFDVSKAQSLLGINARVLITPKQDALFGPRHISFRRFDLSLLPQIKLKRSKAKTHEDLAKLLEFHPLFKYRMLDPQGTGQVKIRYLHLQPSDIVDEVLPNILTSNAIVRLQAHPESDCFIGQLTLVIA